MMRASVSSFFKVCDLYASTMIVFIFLNDMINSNLKPIARIGIIVIIAIYVPYNMQRYKLTYDVTYEEGVNLRIRAKENQAAAHYFSTHNVRSLADDYDGCNNIEMAISCCAGIYKFVVFLRL